MSRASRLAAAASILCGVLLAGPAQLVAQPRDRASGAIFANQGLDWSSAARNEYYRTDQGSRMIPLRWIAALRQPGSDQPFMADALARYGYLANPNSFPAGLPVGFSTATEKGELILGITCAACHTRQITVGGVAWRIDGGPAFADFAGLLRDLDAAVEAAVATPAAFDAFAASVIGRPPSPAERDRLARAVDEWRVPFHLLVSKSVPAHQWGPGRMDAVGLIFNRLSGLDIGPGPDHLLADNILPAEAPVRYPFLWNAPVQDKTQWAGFAPNGTNLRALARNFVEVVGAFAQFTPVKDKFGIDYLKLNSANFTGLRRLEDLTKMVGPPRWPWALDQALVDQGRAIYADKGCQGCHEDRTERLASKRWDTPREDVGTDRRQQALLQRTADTGALEGVFFPGVVGALQKTDSVMNIVRLSVVGSVAQHYFSKWVPFGAERTLSVNTKLGLLSTTVLNGLLDTFTEKPTPAYEARVLRGVWAAAPYLHNGSVPTLQDLLTPAGGRIPSFAVGPEYDPVAVGLAEHQPAPAFVLHTTGCDEISSGNSRCGHPYGTTLSTPDKTALLEYLKSL